MNALKQMNRWMLTLLLMVGHAVSAQAQAAASVSSSAHLREGIRISSYTVSKKQVLVQFGTDEIVRVGTILTAGDGCKLKVAKIKGQKAIATSDDCESKRLIKKGKVV